MRGILKQIKDNKEMYIVVMVLAMFLDFVSIFQMRTTPFPVCIICAIIVIISDAYLDYKNPPIVIEKEILQKLPRHSVKKKKKKKRRK